MVELSKIPEIQNKQTFNAVMKLVIYKSIKSKLFQFMESKIKKDTKLDKVRSRMLKIKGSVSEEVIRSRDERI